MKQPVALLLVAWLASCSFPDFKVLDAPAVPEPTPPGPAVSCTDAVRNGEETGIDCGITACGDMCPAGQGCLGDEDCESARCVEGKCRSVSCQDNAQNGAESDVDCGGDTGCARCGVGKLCRDRNDCDGGDCIQRRCQAVSCRDELQNGGETDVDCSGECPPCVVGQRCLVAADCDGVACEKERCQLPSCSDQLRNQDETDVDCGGGCSATCADGASCKAAEDCQSGVCVEQTLRCAVPTCEDDVLNGAEPSLDCGATCTEKCAILQACRVAGDCTTNSCERDRCLPSQATGEKLSTLGWVATASHVASAQNNSPPLALDGVQQTDWATGSLQALGMWFQIDMQKTQVFYSMEIDSINQPNDAAGAFDIYVSESETFPEPPVLSNYQAKKSQLAIVFPKPQVGRYLKFVLSQGGDKWWRMDEIRVKQ